MKSSQFVWIVDVNKEMLDWSMLTCDFIDNVIILDIHLPGMDIFKAMLKEVNKNCRNEATDWLTKQSTIKVLDYINVKINKLITN